MALFLVFDHNNYHTDPIKQARGCYSLGDIVEVLDDSKHDGDLVRNPVMPPWYLVRITGVTKEQALKYMKPYIEPGTELTPNPVTLRRRQYNVEVGNIPLAVRQTLQADRYIEFTWAQVRNYVRNRLTNELAGMEP